MLGVVGACYSMADGLTSDLLRRPVSSPRVSFEEF
jgi:hypothetical protein